MSFDDYVHYMSQKYRLAIAIAVLKAKPENQSAEEYIDTLKNKISGNNMDTEFLDISLGSDDFNFDDDDLMINDDNDLKDYVAREPLNDSVTILKDVNMNEESYEKAGHEADSFENVMNLLKYVDGNLEMAFMTDVTDNITLCQSTQNQIIALTADISANTDVEMQDIDFHNKQTNATQEITFVDSRYAADTNLLKLNSDVNDHSDRTNFGNCTFSSESYYDTMKDSENSTKNKQKQRTLVQNVYNNISREADIGLVNKTEVDNVHDKLTKILNPANQTTETNQNIMEDDDTLIETQFVERNNDMATKVYRNLEKVNQNTINDSQSTILYSLYESTPNFTHVSQSQNNDLQVHNNFIHGSLKYNDKHNNLTEKQFTSNLKNNDADIANNLVGYALVNDQMPENSNITHTPQIIDIDASEIQYVIDNNGRTYCVLEGLRKEDPTSGTNKILDTNTKKYGLNDTADNQNLLSQELFATNDTDSQNNPASLEKHDIGSKHCEIKDKTEEETKDLAMTQDMHDDILDDDLTVSQKEVIPFKVIEELNKIKTFLNRNIHRRASTDSYTTDSGYRSDSQSKSSFKGALQITGNAINQSAHCVFTHLLQCPLVGSTEDITLEIATILGRLIDKLHENEKYPSFLEDVLDSIDNLLRDISEGENLSNTLILTKDESIQRLLLLNNSSHVIQYSIDKITKILEELHTHLANEDLLYELSNIDLIENVCYIFHILEILIKRYRKTKKDNISSQNSTQNSQDSEGILKKSSITDIWRRKWNPDYKNVKTEGSSDKKCVLTQCSVVLNKIIVDCMEGYSLVSFAALQCFNLLQS